MINVNSSDFWNEQYKNNKDVWNLNNPVPLFVQLIDEEKFMRPGKLMVLGSGKGYEAVYAARKGYDVTGIDFSDEANRAATSLAQKENVHVNFVNEDFFNLGKRYPESFDFLFEYVSICAVLPERRTELLENINAVLKPGGMFISLLFPIDKRAGGPPFSIDMYEFYNMAKKVLTPYYFSRAINSIKPRKNNEVLFIFKKRTNG